MQTSKEASLVVIPTKMYMYKLEGRGQEQAGEVDGILYPPHMTLYTAHCPKPAQHHLATLIKFTCGN